MEIIILFIGILFVGVGGFYAITFIIKLWTGCDNTEAVTKLNNFMHGKIQYSFHNDVGFVEEVWENVRNIIGRKRFEQLEMLSKTEIKRPLIFFGEKSGLPFILVSTPCQDEHEKRVLENVISNLVISYLKIYGLNKQILVNWKVRDDLDMPYLLVRYARTREEKRKLDILLHNKRQKIVARNKSITDDTETEDLDG